MIENEYWYVIDGQRVPNEESMISKLLDDNILFCNSRKFLDPFSNEVREETLVLFLNCNDCFVPAADAECLTSQELPDFFSLYEKLGDWATVEFVARKRKRFFWPRKRIRKRKSGTGMGFL